MLDDGDIFSADEMLAEIGWKPILTRAEMHSIMAFRICINSEKEKFINYYRYDYNTKLYYLKSEGDNNEKQEQN